jgi:2-oxoisovalerate dehydrogenase E1 component
MMVTKINIEPDFRPGFVKVGGRIPRFRYVSSLSAEFSRGTLSADSARMLLEAMLIVRSFEEMIVELRENKGQYAGLQYLFVGPTHVSIGQEAVSVGAISSLGLGDCITSNHRGHGDSLAKGFFAIQGMSDAELVRLVTCENTISEYLGFTGEAATRTELMERAVSVHIYRCIAELFGKEDGYCHGRGGGMHIADFTKGHLGANAIVGGSMGMAVGAALASRYLQEDTIVFCFAGDGAFNNGIAHESMNLATMAQFTNGLMQQRKGVPIIFGIVNNQYGMTGQQREEVTGVRFLAERAFGYSKHGLHAQIVNGMDVLAVRNASLEAVAHARAGKGPCLLEFWCTRYRGHSLSDTLVEKKDETYRSLSELESWKRLDPVYTFADKLIHGGVIDDEELEALMTKTRNRNVSLTRKAAEARNPDALDIYRGLWSQSTSRVVKDEARQASWERESVLAQRDPDTPITYREAVIEALYQEMKRDKTVALWGEDIADYGGAFGATKGLLNAFGRDRIFNTPISEAAIVGAGIGAALRGLRPVVEIMYIDFILQAMDQVANQAAKWKYMSGGQATIPLTIRTTIGGGKGYAGQHSQSIEAILAHFPGLKVVAPADAYDAKGLLTAALRDDNPVIVLEHQNLYSSNRAVSVVPLETYECPLCRAKLRIVVQSDNPRARITVVSWSHMVQVVLGAARQLAREGIELEVVDLQTLIPLDIDTILRSLGRTGRALIVHQAVEFMGLGAEIAAQLQEKGFDSLDGPVLRLAAPGVPPPAAATLEKAFLPDTADVIRAVKQML